MTTQQRTAFLSGLLATVASGGTAALAAGLAYVWTTEPEPAWDQFVGQASKAGIIAAAIVAALAAFRICRRVPERNLSTF